LQAAADSSSSVDSKRVILHAYPPDSPGSTTYKVRSGVKEVFVYRTSSGEFAAFAFEGTVPLEIETSGPAGGVRIAPGRHKIVPETDGNRVRLNVPLPMHLLIEFDGLPQLFLFADAPHPDPSEPEATGGEPTNRYRLSFWGYADALAENEKAQKEPGTAIFPRIPRGRVRQPMDRQPCPCGDAETARKASGPQGLGHPDGPDQDGREIREGNRGHIDEARVNGLIPWAGIQKPPPWTGGDPNPGRAIHASEVGAFKNDGQYEFYKELGLSDARESEILQEAPGNSATTFLAERR
jgi:hypothetical protein